MDRRIGEVLDWLSETHLRDDTIVVVAADHGENLGEHGMLDHKMSVHATLLHVPIVVRYPRGVEAGRKIDTPVQLHDLFPTLLALVGVAPPRGATIEAALLPGIAGGRGRDPKAPIVGEFAGPPTDFLKVMAEAFPGADLSRFDRTLVSFRHGDDTLVWGSDGRHELYRTADDPLETTDLAAKDPARVTALAAEVEAWLHRPSRGGPAESRTSRGL